MLTSLTPKKTERERAVFVSDFKLILFKFCIVIHNFIYPSLISTKASAMTSITSNIMADKTWLLPDGAHEHSMQCLR